MDVLNIKGLKVNFKIGKNYLNIVEGIDLKIEPGEIVGIVGESGSGKTVSMLALTKIFPQSLAKIEYQDYRINEIKISSSQISYLRGRFISYVFQDPIPSLDPMFKIRVQLQEVFRAMGREAKEKEMLQLLEKVGLEEVKKRVLDSYPHQLSGGMAQRVAIGLALASDSKVLVADEPTTALDANLKKGILDLLITLKKDNYLSIFFISHDLNQIFYLADMIYIFYAGRILEIGTKNEIKNNPLHPYTRALLKCIPKIGRRLLSQIEGSPPNFKSLPLGCKFYPRCRKVSLLCQKDEPSLYEVKKRHFVRCHLIRNG